MYQVTSAHRQTSLPPDADADRFGAVSEADAENAAIKQTAIVRMNGTRLRRRPVPGPANSEDGIVVVVVGHGPQSPGHAEQFSKGPQSPSPHTQLQGGDPPVQLQRPALQSAMTCLRQVPLACPLKPLAATSPLQA